MENLVCKMCGKDMGEMIKGKIRNNAVILCNGCWERAKIAIDMAELAKNQAGSLDMPDFLQDLFKKK